MSDNFYAMIHRMRYVYRWGLMRNTWTENLAEHSLDVAVIAHALAVIGNHRLHKQLDVHKVVTLALFHDASEIITGDLPTPIKYYNEQMVDAYKGIEQTANQRLLGMLPPDLRDAYTDIFNKQSQDAYLWKLIKAADKISALIKCIQEQHAGNQEFLSAKNALLQALCQMKLPESDMFLSEFLDDFTKTLDEQQSH